MRSSCFSHHVSHGLSGFDVDAETGGESDSRGVDNIEIVGNTGDDGGIIDVRSKDLANETFGARVVSAIGDVHGTKGGTEGAGLDSFNQ